MREIKLSAVKREVKKAWNGRKCDGHSCASCIEMIGGKYERWFALTDDGYSYLAVVASEDLSADILCPPELEFLKKYNADNDDYVPAHDNAVDWVKIV